MIAPATDYKRGIKITTVIHFLLNLSILFTVLIQFFIESGLYSILRAALYGLFSISVLLVLLYGKKVGSNPFMSFYLLFIYLALLLSLVVSMFQGKLAFGTLLEFSLPILILYIGYAGGFSKEQMSKLVLRYMFLVTTLGLFVIFVYGNGFQITTQYFFSSKNQVGPFVASVAMVALLSLLNSKGNGSVDFKKNILLLVFLVNMGSLLALRNRSGMVAVGICFLVSLLAKIDLKKGFNGKNLLKSSLILAGLPILMTSKIGKGISDLFNQAFLSNYDVSNLDSLSAGRFDVYLNVLNFLGKSPFFGEITMRSPISEEPHNFLLNLWLNYGVMGMLPVTIFYLLLWVTVLYKIILKKEYELSMYLILFMLVISMFEYSYPFSPLTTVSFAWFWLGYSLKNKTDI